MGCHAQRVPQARVQEASGHQSQTHGLTFGWSCVEQELDMMVLTGPIWLRIPYDSKSHSKSHATTLLMGTNPTPRLWAGLSNTAWQGGHETWFSSTNTIPAHTTPPWNKECTQVPAHHTHCIISASFLPPVSRSTPAAPRQPPWAIPGPVPALCSPAAKQHQDAVLYYLNTINYFVCVYWCSQVDLLSANEAFILN